MNQRIQRWLLFLIPLTFMLITPWPIKETFLWLGYGKHLWSDFHFLYNDTVGALATDNNVASAWLLSLTYWGIYNLGGIFAVAHFHHLILILVLALIYKNSIFKNPWPWTVPQRLAIYAMWIGAGGYFSLRPALLSYIPLILSFLILEKRSSKQKPLNNQDLLSLLGLQILWVNLHGSFVILPVLFGWTVLCNRQLHQKKYVFWGAGLAAATLISPFGWQIYPYILKTKDYANILGISEWKPAFSWDFPVQTSLFIALIISIGVYLFKLSGSERLKILGSPFFALFAVACTSVRLSSYLFLVLPIFLNYHTQIYKNPGESEQKPSPFAIYVTFAVILAIAVMGSPYFKIHVQSYLPPHLQAPFEPDVLTKIPEAINQTNNSCAILNDYQVSDSLFFKTNHRLLFDSRTTPYTKAAVIEFKNFIDGKNVGEVIQKTNACFAVLSVKRSSDLIRQLINNFGFKETLKEDDFVLLSR